MSAAVPQRTRAGHVLEFLGIILGTLISACGLNLFLVPNRLNDGGLNGIAVVLHYTVGAPLGAALLLLNVPLFLATTAVLGVRFGSRSLVGLLSLAAFLQLVPLHALTSDPTLASVYGGAIAGFGAGIVFRSGGSTGGTDLVAGLLRRFTHLSTGQGLLVVDVVIIGITGLVFGPQRALYSILALFIETRVIDAIQEGLDYQKSAFIISSEGDRIGAVLMKELGRGVTRLQATGMFTGTERPVLMVVVSRAEVARLKRMVHGLDPGAFVVIMTAHEVLGEGFRRPDRE